MYLRARGYDPFVISTDDYFLEREETPKKPDGSYEFEAVESLDIKLFNKQMKELLDGKEIVMPTFNFITGEKEFKNKPIHLEKNQILVVEG
jgi:uridine kinase